MAKFLVHFTQVSEHRVGAVVESSDIETAKAMVRNGLADEEFDLGLPESVELKAFTAREVSEETVEEWLEKQRERNKED